MDLEERAKLFATAAHAAIDQRRKYTNEPYIVHPADVVSILRTVAHTVPMLAAAWLHDVVEDTKITLDLIAIEFGPDVANLVYWLTDVSKPQHGNRAARKAMDRDHIAMAPREAQTIKVADIISNSRTIFKHDADFARTYLREKEALLDVLTKAASPLIRQAKDILEEYSGIIHHTEGQTINGD